MNQNYDGEDHSDPNFTPDNHNMVPDAGTQDDEEIDLTPYEEDDDETLHRKLVHAKIARKRAEEDLKLLSNRINLLKMEESKAFKKIDSTRKKAMDIVQQRKRNIENQQEKMVRQQQKANEEAQKTMVHRA
jgi:ElaB/YqjD/DUF883 family membrane-anchored ribosome-binding protein